MIINRQHRFVFIHIPKTGGSSISAALMSVDGSEKNPLGPGKHTTQWKLQQKTWWRDPSLFRFRFFAFVRNPWDRAYSLYRYLSLRHEQLGYPCPPEFPVFVQMLGDKDTWVGNLHSARPQSDFISRRAFMIGRFENISDDFDRICRAMEISAELPHLNASRKADDYRSAYDQRSKDTVERLYVRDVERFGYQF